MSASKGLSAEEIIVLQSLKPGDRLILWDNTRGAKEGTPELTLAKYETH